MRLEKKYMKIIINTLIVVCVLLFIYYVLPKMIVLFMPFIIGCIIALIVNPIVNFLEKRLHIKRKHSSLIAILFTLLVGGGIVYLILSRLITEIQTLIGELPLIYTNILEQLSILSEKLSVIYDKLPMNMQNIINNTTDNIQEQLFTFVKSSGKPTLKFAGNFAKGLPSALIFTVVLIMSSYFISAEKEAIGEFFINLIPDKVKEKFNIIKKDLKFALGGYVKAQLTIMMFVFIIVFTGFSVINVSYKLLLALLISVFDALPFFGSGGILIPWAIINLVNGDPKTALGLAVIYLIVLITRQVLEPRILGKRIGLHPLVTLMGMYVGLKLFGVIGIILGAPTILIFKNLYKAGVFDGLIRFLKSIFVGIGKVNSNE